MNSYQKLKQEIAKQQLEIQALKSDIKKIVIDKDQTTIARWYKFFEFQSLILRTALFGERKILQQQKGNWDEKTQTGRMGGLVEVIIQKDSNE